LEVSEFVPDFFERVFDARQLCTEGGDVPVASAIMALVYPDKYTILDFRALEALGDTSRRNSVTFYLHYLRYCVALAKKWGLSLRDLDHALWHWSKNRQT
jgi:hypothetical protein